LWKLEKKFDVQTDNNSIISMAALFIQMILKCRYITASNIVPWKVPTVIQNSLSLLLNEVLKSKATQTNQRRCTSVTHAI